MAFPTFKFTKNGLYKLDTCLILVHIKSIVFSFVTMSAAFEMKKEISDLIELVSPMGSDIFPVISLGSSILCVIVNTYGLLIIVKCRPLIKLRVGNKYSRQLFIYSIAQCVVTVITLVGFLIGMVHAKTIHGLIPSGIQAGMKAYANDLSSKVRIDKLQIKFECCGSRSYKEWFVIPWFDTRLGGAPPKSEGDFVSDDVPFSCCSGGGIRQCIHHGILSSGAIYRYDPQRHLSISKRGCHKALEERCKSLLSGQTLILLFGAFVQLSISAATRTLQTALYARIADPNSEVHRGYIFGRAKKEETYLVEAAEEEEVKPAETKETGPSSTDEQ